MKPRNATVAMAMMLGMMPFFPVGELTAPSVRHERRKPKGPKPNKFRRPHQGTKECARRVRQNSGQQIDSKLRRMWTMNTMFGQYKSSRRDPLARLHFHKNFHLPVVLLP